MAVQRTSCRIGTGACGDDSGAVYAPQTSATLHESIQLGYDMGHIYRGNGLVDRTQYLGMVKNAIAVPPRHGDMWS